MSLNNYTRIGWVHNLCLFNCDRCHSVVSDRELHDQSHDQVQRLRNAIYAMVNSLGGALPRTPEVRAALDALVESDMAST